MQLDDWLTRERLTFGQFGGAISRTAEAVRRYAKGERIPDRDTMAAIVRETSAEVTPNDFYGVPRHAQGDNGSCSSSSSGNPADLTAAQQSEAA